MATNIGPKIGVEGEAEFKREIASINSSLKTMGAEMDMVTSAFIGNEKSVEALTAKNDVLAARMDELSKKADVQKARLAELDAAGVDPTSKAYQTLLADLYKTEAAMNKTEAEIKANSAQMDDLGDETKETAQELDKGGDSAKTFGDVLKANLVSEAIIGGIKALAAAVKAVGEAVLDAAASADELQTLSVKTGIATSELQKYQYAAEAIDVDVETITGSMTKLTSAMSSAASGSASAVEAFEALGVEVTDQDGALRDRNEVFQEAIKALGEIENETERDAAAMKIFGKSAQDLNPLILGGADALAELGAHAEEAGLILSDDALSSLSALNDSFGIFQQTLSMAGQQVLAQFAEPLTEAMTTVTGYVEELLAAFREGGLGALGETVGEIANDVTAKLTGILPDLAAFATQAITTVASGLIAQLPTIVKAALEIVTSLVDGLVDALPELIPVAIDAVLTLVDTLTDPETLGSPIDGAIAIVMALADGLIDALPKLLEAAFEVIVSLAKGIIDNLPEIGKAAMEIINTLLTGLATLWEKMIGVGEDIVRGIWEGISGAASWLWEKVSGFFNSIVGGVMDFLGIHSPSTVFAGIGENMAEGIGVGFDRTMAQVERDMMTSIPTPSVDLGGVALDAGAYGGAGMVEEITIPVEIGGVELARVLYRHIVGEGQRIGAAAVG